MHFIKELSETKKETNVNLHKLVEALKHNNKLLTEVTNVMRVNTQQQKDFLARIEHYVGLHNEIEKKKLALEQSEMEDRRPTPDDSRY